MRAVVLVASLLGPQAQAQGYDEAPRVVATLAQGLAAEHGIGIRQNIDLATELYCDAASMGSSEGFFRIGRMLAQRSPKQRSLANAYLALAAIPGNICAPATGPNRSGSGAACGRFGALATGRFGSPRFNTSGLPKQADRASAAAAATSIRGFRRVGIGMAVKIPTRWLTASLTLPQLVGNFAGATHFV